jgi:pro-apoptotic serine protease NMA111
LGLTKEWETIVRNAVPGATGMLIANIVIVLPNRPAGRKIQEGDALLRMEDQVLMNFVDHDAILDSLNVEKKYSSCIVLRNGRELGLNCRVGDLHAITPPSRFVTQLGRYFIK